jgi:hypothetical protein
MWVGPVSLLALVAVCACSSASPGPSGTATGPDTAKVPLTDLRTSSYLGFQGGLYPGASNTLPSAHASRGMAQAALIQPVNTAGQPDPAGKYVLLSIGMSNTTQEFCAASGTTCASWTFSGQAAVDPAVNHSTLAIANGARGGQVAEAWDQPNEDNYRRIRDEVLAPAGLSEAQVQIVWMKVARSNPRSSLPAPDADAYVLQDLMGDIARALKVRYPNLRQVFVSSRIYAGFATTTLNPEPYAYESGFAVKWLIESQSNQLDRGAIDPRSGDLSLQVAPWLAWGPYLWARDSASPRSDGLFWVFADFQSDGTHPSQSGEQKVGKLLLDFFKTSPQSRCWFLAGQRCN